MPKQNSNREAKNLLVAIKRELQCLGLWQGVLPEPEKLNYKEPFGIDTMEFHEWLEFILIGKMSAMIDAGADLSSLKLAIAPMAEIVYAEDHLNKRKLISLLADLDNYFKG